MSYSKLIRALPRALVTMVMATVVGVTMLMVTRDVAAAEPTEHGAVTEVDGDTNVVSGSAAGLVVPLLSTAITPSICIAQSVEIGDVGDSCWDKCNLHYGNKIAYEAWSYDFAAAMFPGCVSFCECMEAGEAVC